MLEAGPAPVLDLFLCFSFSQTAGHVRVEDGKLQAHGCSAKDGSGGGAACAGVAALPQDGVAYFQIVSILTNRYWIQALQQLLGRLSEATLMAP